MMSSVGFGSMEEMLSKFVALKSVLKPLHRHILTCELQVSGNHKEFGEECWHAAKFLQRHLTEVGCETVELIGCGDDRNPIVYGRVNVDPALPYVLVYGHYDVMPATKVGHRHALYLDAHIGITDQMENRPMDSDMCQWRSVWPRCN